jgi:hypothetical protein
MLTERVSTATRDLWRSVTACARNVLTFRERYQAMIDARGARGITLLREWLSPMQRAQFDATKYFDVVGCDTGRRYRIHYGRVTNVHHRFNVQAPGGCSDGGTPTDDREAAATAIDDSIRRIQIHYGKEAAQ